MSMSAPFSRSQPSTKRTLFQLSMLLLALVTPSITQQAAVVPVEDAPGRYTVTMPAEPAWRAYLNGQSVVRMTLCGTWARRRF